MLNVRMKIRDTFVINPHSFINIRYFSHSSFRNNKKCLSNKNNLFSAYPMMKRTSVAFKITNTNYIKLHFNRINYTTLKTIRITLTQSFFLPLINSGKRVVFLAYVVQTIKNEIYMHLRKHLHV